MNLFTHDVVYFKLLSHKIWPFSPEFEMHHFTPQTVPSRIFKIELGLLVMVRWQNLQKCEVMRWTASMARPVTVSPTCLPLFKFLQCIWRVCVSVCIQVRDLTELFCCCMCRYKKKAQCRQQQSNQPGSGSSGSSVLSARRLSSTGETASKTGAQNKAFELAPLPLSAIQQDTGKVRTCLLFSSAL